MTLPGDFKGTAICGERDNGHYVVCRCQYDGQQAICFQNWLDAPFFIVLGDILNFDTISLMCHHRL
jgi:hypothetical protein